MPFLRLQACVWCLRVTHLLHRLWLQGRWKSWGLQLLVLQWKSLKRPWDSFEAHLSWCCWCRVSLDLIEADVLLLEIFVPAWEKGHLHRQDPLGPWWTSISDLSLHWRCSSLSSRWWYWKPDITQPCLTPVFTGNQSDFRPFLTTQNCFQTSLKAEA